MADMARGPKDVILIGSRELAERLGVSRQLVTTKARAGEWPAVLLGHGGIKRRWFFEYDAVLAAIKKATVTYMSTHGAQKKGGV